MYYEIKARVHSENAEGTVLRVLLPDVKLSEQLERFSDNNIVKGELRIDDGRTIRADQRKKAWATLGDIALWNGDDREVNHWHLKEMFMTRANVGRFSLSDCSVSIARDYISFLLEFCLEWDVPLSEPILGRTDDINRAIFASIINRRCIVCGRVGEIHHVDAIGMGRDRKTVDDSRHLKICLCRIHHDEAHTIGRKTFEEKYHCYGIIYRERGVE